MQLNAQNLILFAFMNSHLFFLDLLNFLLYQLSKGLYNPRHKKGISIKSWKMNQIFHHYALPSRYNMEKTDEVGRNNYISSEYYKATVR